MCGMVCGMEYCRLWLTKHFFPPSLKGGLTHFPPKFAHFFGTCHNFFPLSSVQIIIIPACCLLCVL